MPVTIGTSTDGYATDFMPKRKVLAIGIYYFDFYSDGVNMGYRTRLIAGGAWSAFTIIRACTEGRMFSIRYRNIGGVDYVYYTYSSSVVNTPVLFCRGTVVGASITWDPLGPYTARAGSVLYAYYYPDLEIAIDNSVYVSYSQGSAAQHRVMMNYNPNNDGSGIWSQVAVTPNELGADYFNVGLVALSNNNIYIGYARSIQLRGKLWTGALGAEEIITGNLQVVFFGMITDGGTDVAVAWSETGTFSKKFNLRDIVAGWGVEETIFDAGGSSRYTGGVHLGIDLATGQYVAIWVEDGRTSDSAIQYSVRNGAWGVVVNLATGESYVFWHSCIIMENALNDIFGVTWTCQELSPYNVRFDEINLAPPPAFKAGLHPSKILPIILDD